jgi:hypothetical protein
MAINLSSPTRVQAFLTGYRQKEAVAGKVVSKVVSKGATALWDILKGVVKRPGVVPAAVGTGVTGYHLSEGEPLYPSLIAGTGAGILSSRRLWQGLAKPKGDITYKYMPRKNIDYDGSTHKSFGVKRTPQRDNVGVRYLAGVGIPAAMVGAPEFRKALSAQQASLNANTSDIAEGFVNISRAIPGATEALTDSLAAAIKQVGDTGEAINPGVTDAVESVKGASDSLATLASRVADTVDNLTAAVDKGADYIVANPKKVMAIGATYMLGAGGVAGLVVWLREVKRRRTLEEQDKRQALQQQKMMKMVLQAQN